MYTKCPKGIRPAVDSISSIFVLRQPGQSLKNILLRHYTLNNDYTVYYIIDIKTT